MKLPEFQFKHWLASVLIILAIISAQAVQAACSSYSGKIVLNEYNYIDNYIELKILDTSVVGATTQFADWRVWVFRQSKLGSPASQNVGSIYTDIAANTCGTATTQYYIRIPFQPADLDNDVNVVLADKNNNIVDVFRVDQTAVSSYYSGFNSCTVTYSNLTDAPPTGTAGNKDIARLPDGTGPWVISPGTGNNSQSTLCGSNDGVLAITKTPSSASVGIGSASPFTWTITLTNGGTKSSLSNVTVSDTLPANMFLSVCPAGATCSGSAGAYTGFSQNVGSLASGASTSIVATAYVTAAGTYNNTATATATELAPGYTSASGTVQTATVGSFNAFETSTAASAITGVIKTKIAGSAFALDVVAISGGVQSVGFSNNVKVELLANTGTSGTGYGADNCPTSSTVIQTIASAAISNGRSTVNFGAVANSYRDVRVRVSYPTTSPSVTGCSTDSFAIRPNLLTLSVTDADWQTAGNTNLLNNVGATGGVIHKAGRPFSIASIAQNAAVTPMTTTNYDGIPNAALTACAGTACTTSFGVFSLGGTFTNGALNSTAATYTEVGAINMQLQDVNYAVIDSADTNPDCTATGYYVCSATSAVGRFVPDHFDTAVLLVSGVPMACATGLTCPVDYNGMVYSGQNFTLQVTARNAANNITANYSATTGLSKNVALTAWNTSGGATQLTTAPGTLNNTVLASTGFALGVASTATVNYAFNTQLTNPTAIYLRAEDVDILKVSSLRTPAALSVEGGVEVVSGRIKLNNVYGSELLPLTVTAAAQYYSANGWVNNVGDSNTVLTGIPASYIVGSGSSLVTLTPASGALSAGVLSIKLGKPGSPGMATITPTAPAYLQVIPGTATFGVYSGNNRLIYQREVY